MFWLPLILNPASAPGHGGAQVTPTIRGNLQVASGRVAIGEVFVIRGHLRRRE
jgi:hypothetical protein